MSKIIIKNLMEELFPICRSITGDGVRQSLDIINKVVKINIDEIPTGTKCYDWTVPKEWNINDAYIADLNGNHIVDFQDNNIHLMGYSIPMNTEMTLQELESHLSISDPLKYRTSYYKEDWGFSLTPEQYAKFNNRDKYKVVIDSSLKDGSLTYGDKILRGLIPKLYSQRHKEFIFSTYCCHPSMGNDNLSGMIVWTLLLKYVESLGQLKNTYRFIIVPETIGAIAYLSKNEKEMRNIDGGYTVCTVGGSDEISYKRSFEKNSYIDRIADRAFIDKGYGKMPFDIGGYKNYQYDCIGSDERQYSSPGFRIPVGSIFKGECNYENYKKVYHTSADNLDYINIDNLLESLGVYIKIIENMEKDITYIRPEPHCEPMFSKYGLYNLDNNTMYHLRWLMFLCDGKNSLLDIAEKINTSIGKLYKYATLLCEKGLLTEYIADVKGGFNVE